MEIFEDYAYYYNAFYTDKDYKAEAQQVHSLLSRHGNNVKHLINFGCGTGRHDIELSDMGYQCTGIDKSPSMIKIAKENVAANGKDIRFLVDDIRHHKGKRQYDAVISLFHVMSYQNTNEDILSTFPSARTALSVGGIFLFDVLYGPGVLSDKPVVRVREVQNEKYELVRIATPVMCDKTNTVEIDYKILAVSRRTNETKIINETHRMRYFFRPELEFYLDKSGFELLDNLDCQTLGETGYNSWTSFFVARAV